MLRRAVVGLQFEIRRFTAYAQEGGASSACARITSGAAHRDKPSANPVRIAFIIRPPCQPSRACPVGRPYSDLDRTLSLRPHNPRSNLAAGEIAADNDTPTWPLPVAEHLGRNGLGRVDGFDPIPNGLPSFMAMAYGCLAVWPLIAFHSKKPSTGRMQRRLR
jgi:hypothetical protein